MKNLKKLASVALALVMAMALMVPAFATDLTITNANMSESYTAYKILDATINADRTAYSYSAATGWGNFLDTDAAKAVLTPVTPTTNPVTYKEATPAPTAAQMETFAKEALAYAVDNSIASVGTATKNEADSTVTISDLEPGYYVIDSTMGTVCMVQTADGELTINEKNETVPVPEKTPDYSAITKGVGDVITYTVEVDVKAGAENYVLHDTMSTGLRYNNDVAAVIKDTQTSVSLTPATLAAGDTFAVSIDNVGNYVDQTIVFNYTATITAAAVNVDDLTNTATVTYGNGSSVTSNTTHYDLGDITINKWALAAAGTRTELTGAKFALYQTAEGGTPISLVLDNGSYRPAVDGETGVTEIDMSEVATMTIKGLKAGTYYLEETQAPDGYNKLEARQIVTINASVDETTQVMTVTNASADVDNQTGAVLPSTGGMGTTIFYAVGGVLLVGSAILFVTKKRMGE